ncbi:uncharacterized protein F4822DRAFT_405385 [Hypoxylon trugodes]|uniref:uncharacterized protein n=1 Tax=Hypoxylon trugodes TaxID=326681 RepID=UPI0021A1209C|nr:uncharacterized protein F4822DRAFT_405385 [Hypoxylon trugodes]KAI1389221.1 hypothetical protein F4822DRAFT_405385 [Hypoxylon trugodes]
MLLHFLFVRLSSLTSAPDTWYHVIGNLLLLRAYTYSPTIFGLVVVTKPAARPGVESEIFWTGRNYIMRNAVRDP